MRDWMPWSLKLPPCDVVASFFIMEEMQGPFIASHELGGVGKLTCSSVNCEQLTKQY